MKVDPKLLKIVHDDSTDTLEIETMEDLAEELPSHSPRLIMISALFTWGAWSENFKVE